MYDVTATIVVYDTDLNILKETIESFLAANIRSKLIIIDNNRQLMLREYCFQVNVEYVCAGKNLGFGRAHNVAIKKYAQQSKYFLILNPDVRIHEGCIESLFSFMETNLEVGLCGPKILNEDGSIQYVHKRLPSVFLLFMRRFAPGFVRRKYQHLNDLYEIRDQDFSKYLEVPVLSGCFMFFRSSFLKEIGGFDQRYFMYMEDVDICRKAAKYGMPIYVPEAVITHRWQRGSYHSRKLMIHNISSAVKYFFKWGLCTAADVKTFHPRQ